MKVSKYKNDIMTKQRIIKHKIRVFNNSFNRVLDEELSETEVFAGESRLLMIISENENISQREIAKKMNTSAPSVGVSLRKIEEKGYILRQNSEKDSRANKIVLTKKGDDFVEKTHSIFQTLDKKTFKGFTQSELDTLDILMDKLQNNLDKMLEASK